MCDPFINPKHIQGSDEWLDERLNHIGASEAPAIMGVDPWKTAYQIWEEKLGLREPVKKNAAMERGNELEPYARKAFEESSGFEVFPQCVYHREHSFMMASMDGLSLDGTVAVEIKCPGAKTHEIAVNGKVPKHYMPQLQHQMACCNLTQMWYYSFDGENGVAVLVERDDEYISKLIEKEKEFWECVITRTAPPLTSRDYVEKDSELWISAGMRIAEIDEEMKRLKAEREKLRLGLIEDADGNSCRGGGITLCRTFPIGRVDYKAIPELSGVDLDKYRSPSKETWTLRVGKK